MDEPKVPTKSADAANSPKSGQFMDFHTQTQKPSNDTAPTLPDPAMSDEISSDPLPLDNDTDKDVPAQETAAIDDEQPVKDATVNSAEAVTEDPVNAPPVDSETVDKTDSSAAVEPEAATPPNPLAIPAHASHKSGAPVLAIAAAVVVALALAGLVVFTFMSSKKDSLGSKNSSIPASQTASKPLASPADVDATNKVIDASLSKIDDSKDFSATGLSDATLGL